MKSSTRAEFRQSGRVVWATSDLQVKHKQRNLSKPMGLLLRLNHRF